MVSHHRGAEHTIKAEQIATALDLCESQVRAIIKALIEEDGKIICSNANGFFIPVKPEEALKYAESLKSRIISINHRLNSLKNLIPVEFFKELQMELFNRGMKQ